MAVNADSPIEQLTKVIEQSIRQEVERHAREPIWVTHYGANDIHPRHLVYWIVVKTDREKQRLEQDTQLLAALRGLLVEHGYPAEGRDGVMIGYESHETVNRESRGDFWLHWK